MGDFDFEAGDFAALTMIESRLIDTPRLADRMLQEKEVDIEMCAFLERVAWKGRGRHLRPRGSILQRLGVSVVYRLIVTSLYILLILARFCVARSEFESKSYLRDKLEASRVIYWPK